ncbi:hypothetical protein VSDG_01185 [Cytospora chrysosperma]|uniref:Uncharacterized protein n=1 Tax=Cytospora chrysosperma TaxID=252740 RepID=A0A423WLD8_CYTCH|nr:hypothetical protein VSDG_01185 [Valsa sordida]
MACVVGITPEAIHLDRNIEVSSKQPRKSGRKKNPLEAGDVCWLREINRPQTPGAWFGALVYAHSKPQPDIARPEQRPKRD